MYDRGVRSLLPLIIVVVVVLIILRTNEPGWVFQYYFEDVIDYKVVNSHDSK